MKVEAVILDWAGTVVDFGSCGPVSAMVAAFKEFGVVLSEADARKPMGKLKRDHIAALFALPNVASAWQAKHGSAATEIDAETVYQRFVTLQELSLADHAALIPGVLQVITRLHERGVKIGSSTGYTRAMLNPVAEAAAKQGYRPDASVTPDEVGSGRPKPFMILENLVRLGVWPPSLAVKVGDTPVDMEEGRNAGLWTVGVAGTGNGIGAGWEEYQRMSSAAREQRIATTRKELYESGAHFVIDTLAELEDVLLQIESGIARSPQEEMPAIPLFKS